MHDKREHQPHHHEMREIAQTGLPQEGLEIPGPDP